MREMPDIIKIIGAIMVLATILTLAIRGFEIVTGVRFY